VSKPPNSIEDCDEQKVVKAHTLPYLIDEWDIPQAIDVEFDKPEPEVAELLKRPAQKDEPARLDGALEPPVEQLKGWQRKAHEKAKKRASKNQMRSEEHTSELQSRFDLVCRLLLEESNGHRRAARVV